MSPGVGVVASGYRVVGGGGPTISAIEVIAAALPGSVNGTPTVTTSLVSTDCVVVMVSKQATAGTPAVAGLSATWVSDASNTSTYDTYVWSATGITGGGVITISGLSTSPCDYAVYVLRSSTASTPALVGSAQALTNVSVAAGVAFTATGVAASAGAIVLGMARVSAGTIDFPVSGSSTPSTGYTTDYTNGTLVKAVHQTLGSGATVSLTSASSSSGGRALIQAIYA